MSDAASAAAAAVLGDMFPGGYGDEAAASDEAAEQTAPQEQEQPVIELPDFGADTAGIEDLLDEPDPEPDLELEDPDDDEPVLAQQDEFTDPEVAKLKAKLAKAEKQLRFQQELRAKDNLKGWRAEAARRFPLADADEITGTSRRAVLRKAQEQHDRVEKKIKPFVDAVEGLRAGVIAEAKAEGRAHAEQAFGKPMTGPGVAQVEAAEDAEQRQVRKPGATFYQTVQQRIRNGMQI